MTIAKVTHTEHDEQAVLIEWAEARAAYQEPRLGLLFAIPNGGLRTKGTAGKLKAEGVKPSVPDLFLPVSMMGYHGLWIELKVVGGYVTPGQRQMHEALRAQGYFVKVAYGYEEARDMLIMYLGMEKEY